MLRLVRLYSNQEKIFPTIEFRTGLNIVYAAVTKQAKDKRTSHSVGKTLLADVIDYCLIKKAGKDFFLRSNSVFSTFTFYLEVQTSDNLYITIERSVVGKISLYSSMKDVDIRNENTFSLVKDNLGVDAARAELNNIIKLSVVKNALGTFRKGLRYCIRKQEEYSDIFKAKNYNEKDKDWKPFLSGLLGINADLVSGKYNTKEFINRLKTAIKEIDELDSPSDSAAALEAEITRVEKSVNQMGIELDQFSFQKIDESITKELVEEVGKNIVEVNNAIYSLEQRISDINSSLETSFDYDVELIKELYDSIEVNLPQHLIKSFEDLVQLNKKMTSGREEQLRDAKEELSFRLAALTKKRSELNERQEYLSSLLVEKEAFKKYKLTRKKLSSEESKLAVLKDRLDKLDSASELRTKLADYTREEEELTSRLMSNARQSNNSVIKNVNGIFGELVKDSLGIDAYFFLTINKEGNPHFQADVSDHTSVNKGHSINKVMAACFDLSLLTHYSDSEYYRFSYHDGLLESLDDRVKLRLIDSWRKLAEVNHLQLIVTVLDTDIPENSLGSKVHFNEDEIIRELNDKGDNGRLFKMPKF
jgi:uncharacterized protein YydD (DUF2326 family)|tara:strand:- start:2565 stop:4334 length:1770 start_codon:yes stop_codon:yes gene_type:complete